MDELIQTQKIEEPDLGEFEILEEVREKHKQDVSDTKMSDVIVTQCILCLLIIAGLLILNIFYPAISQELVEKYKSQIAQGTEEIIVDTVAKISDIINAVPK